MYRKSASVLFNRGKKHRDRSIPMAKRSFQTSEPPIFEDFLTPEPPKFQIFVKKPPDDPRNRGFLKPPKTPEPPKFRMRDPRADYGLHLNFSVADVCGSR